MWPGLLGGLLAATAAAAYPQRVRPWHLRWGATEAETGRPLPGDALITAPISVSTRAITIQAPVERVWPWVVQMGQERGGLYSYEFLENLVGSDIHNADRVVPAWQTRRVGEEFRLASAERNPPATLVVAGVEPPRLLLLRSPNVGGTASAPPTEYGYTWAFVLEPAESEATRFIARSRYQGPRPVVLLMELAQFVMERATLRGLKRRAERPAAGTAPVAAAVAAA
jgi:hypothetical protein